MLFFIKYGTIQYMLRIYLIILGILGSLDFLWLGIISKEFYKSYLGFLFRPQAYLTPALLWYFIYSIGLIVFVISPAMKSNSSIKSVFILGSFLGLIAYSTYNLVDYSTIANWPLKVAIVDTLWGVLASGLTCALTFLIINHFKIS